MNQKRVLLVIISSSLLLWMFSLLFSAFVNAIPEGTVVKGNYLITLGRGIEQEVCLQLGSHHPFLVSS
jgi:hypothetical protein